MPGGGTYWVAMMDGQPVGGIFPAEGPDYENMPDNWMPYLAVDDVNARAQMAVKAGGKMMRILDIPEVGRLALIIQPGGAGIGWITPV